MVGISFDIDLTNISFWSQAFSPENEEISSPPPYGFLIEYIYFMNIGQPKLSEIESKRWAVCSTY
jgi:hypothetical protein